MSLLSDSSAPHLDLPDLRVALLDVKDCSAWDAFVNDCPQASFFHLSGWKKIIEEAFGHKTFFLYAKSGNTILGVLPLAQIKSTLFGHTLSSLPFCVYGGIASQSAEATHKLDEAAQHLALSLNVDYLEYRNLHPQHPEWKSTDLYVTFRKALDADVEKNMLEIPRKQRAMVRKGIKAGLVSELDDDIQRFFSVYSDSVHRLGTPVFAKKYFRLLRDIFGNACEVLTVRQKNRVIASVLVFYFRDEVLPYYGGGTIEARELAGFDFMYWELMRRSVESGYKVFDYGRSKRGTGSFDFKKNWGFTPQPLYYEYLLYRGDSVPQHNPLNPKYRLFISAWRKLPLVVANWLGPHIVKNLG